MGVFVNGPAHELEVQGRRKVTTVEAAEKLDAELNALLTKLQEAGKTINISDFDLSQNHCPAESFQVLFHTLITASVKVQRWRLFGCPTFTDEVAGYFAEYLGSVTSETAPLELHLSDCAITSDGFTTIMSAIEDNAAFPVLNEKTKKTTPLYMRLEQNYIEDSVIKEKMDSGVIKKFEKGWKNKIQSIQGEEKVYLLSKKGEEGFQQKKGTPPAPEDVDAKSISKPVYESWKQPKGSSKGSPMGAVPWGGQLWQWMPDPQWQAPQSWGKGAGKGAGPKAKAKPVATKPVGPQPVAKAALKPVSKPVASIGLIKPLAKAGAAAQKGKAWPASNALAGKGSGKGKATSGTANDRSRTPVSRSMPAQPKKPPPKKNGLPHPWQEQFSDEYQIPYYWNPESQESSWEKPTA